MSFWTLSQPTVQCTNHFLIFASQDTSLEYAQRVVWKNLKIPFSAIFHIFSCFELGDYKSSRAGPYCFGLITCLGTLSKRDGNNF